ncbi:MAG TPA: polyprenyl synthetase family protein [Gemmatimonadaceae bacterium]|nr:polyprenyl synthetase family protein [Gemmatimonadaceae bacterium]
MSGIATRTRVPATAALHDIQAPVAARLEDVATEIERLVTDDLPLIQAVSSHLLLMRGKMFRPTLALLVSAALDRPEPRAIRLGAVIELMHLATLVHDDSVDHSVLRRGLPTVNSLFSHQISVIMGDFLYSRALIGLVDMGDLAIMKIITDVANELTIGEMRQLGAVDELRFSEEEYYRLIRNKTASLMAAACESGALCGAAEFRQAMARYGDRLGMAFQIADDILDYTESEAVTGKPGGLDLREHKVTLPLIGALPNVSKSGRERIDALFAAESPGDELIADVIAIVTEAGGIEYARRRGAQFAHDAEQALGVLPESPVRSALTDSIAYVMDRRS